MLDIHHNVIVEKTLGKHLYQTAAKGDNREGVFTYNSGKLYGNKITTD